MYYSTTSKKLVNEQNVDPPLLRAITQLARINNNTAMKIARELVQILFNRLPNTKNTNRVFQDWYQGFYPVDCLYSFTEYFSFWFPHQSWFIVKKGKWLAWEPAIIQSSFLWQRWRLPLLHIAKKKHSNIYDITKSCLPCWESYFPHQVESLIFPLAKKTLNKKNNSPFFVWIRQQKLYSYNVIP